LLDAVVFSGGEPLAQPELPAAIDAVRQIGLAVGLHTSGAYPRRLAQVLPRLDWVGIDVKAPIGDYGTVTGIPGSGLDAFTSLDLVRGSGVAHEVRTTVHPVLTPPSSMERLARELAARGIERWILQACRATGCANEALAASAPKGAPFDRGLLARLSEHVPVIEIRV
jgi:pyruvate formate lyase activating enzyme